MELRAEKISRIYLRNGHGTNIFHAVQNTDFALEPGKFTEIIGRSGSGKTTFIHMLAGLLTPSEGKVFLNGEDFYSLDDSKRSFLRNQKIGMIPQGQTGLPGMTVLENVLTPVAMYGNAEKQKDRAKELLLKMGIGDLEEVYSNELSGGELRRMSIARALINTPEIIIADEPTGDLDDEATSMILRLFRDLADHGASVLMVTHESAAIPFADQVYQMEQGMLTGLDK